MKQRTKRRKEGGEDGGLGTSERTCEVPRTRKDRVRSGIRSDVGWYNEWTAVPCMLSLRAGATFGFG